MDDKTKSPGTWQKINFAYIGFLLASGLFWLFQWHTVGISVAIATVVIVLFLHKRNRWAYFAAAVYCFGLLRIAMDDGNNFYNDWQNYGKALYLMGLVLALILHEKVAIKS